MSEPKGAGEVMSTRRDAHNSGNGRSDVEYQYVFRRKRVVFESCGMLYYAV
jgi:hypothetical protein